MKIYLETDSGGSSGVIEQVQSDGVLVRDRFSRNRDETTAARRVSAKVMRYIVEMLASGKALIIAPCDDDGDVPGFHGNTV